MSVAIQLSKERQAAILALLREQGRVLSAELAATWGISEDSVRRDLRALARQGYTVLLTPPEPLPARISQDETAKQSLGQAAARLVQPGQLVLLDAGSINLAIAQALPGDRHLTVATHAPVIAAALLQRRGHPGADDRRPGRAGVGWLSGRTGLVRSARCPRGSGLPGTCALAVEAGVTGVDLEEAKFKAAVAEQSSQVAVAVTTEKLDSVAFYHVLDLDRVNHLVVEPGLSERRLQPYRNAGLQLHSLSSDC